MAGNDAQKARTFTKKVGDTTHTRTAYTEADAVAATYDGYTEQTSKSSTSSSSTKSSGSSSS